MWPESAEQPAPLRNGLTTGTCATACCVAAARALLTGKQEAAVDITLPRGQVVSLQIEHYQALAQGMRTATIKDAGDDPDVTHGALIFVELYLTATPGVQFKAGSGVGTVTRDGLALSIGEPAINPVPRKMMADHLHHFAQTYQYQGGFTVYVGVEKGEELAQKTMNPRLGIVGGLSILGTTGIVRPYSCAAYIASIHQGVDVASTNGYRHIAASTGSGSEAAIAEYYQLPDIALIEMGDFAGALLKYLRKGKIHKLSVSGGFGKITKLANGHLDLNSRVSSIDFAHMAHVAATLGADEALQQAILGANTSIEVLKLCQQQGIDLAHAMCLLALQFAQSVVTDPVEIEVWAVDRRGQFIACSKGLDVMLGNPNRMNNLSAADGEYSSEQ